MNNKKFLAAVAIILIVVFAWKSSQLKGGPIHLAPTASATPALTTKAEQQEQGEPEAVTPPPKVHRHPHTKCLDGSALTITSSDSNQTNYKCASGAEGAYLNLNH